MIRTPKAGEIWVWKECEFHNQLRDVVLVVRNFEDHPDFIRQRILGCLYCGCQYASDDAEAAIRELRQYEEQRKRDFQMEYQLELQKALREARKTSSLWSSVVAFVILLVAALVVMGLMKI